MKKEMREARKQLLREVRQLESECDVCEIRYHFHCQKDPTGLSDACSKCPVYAEISQYGDKLLKLTEPRVKNKIAID